MKTSGKDSKESNRFRGIRPETEEKYRRAIEMYASTELSGCEICRICEVTESGFRCYLTKYHRELVLARYAILCSKEEAGQIKLGQPCTHYPEIIEWLEKVRDWLGIGDGLPRGTRRSCKE